MEFTGRNPLRNYSRKREVAKNADRELIRKIEERNPGVKVIDL